MLEVMPIKSKTEIEEIKKSLKPHLRDYCLFILGINTGLRVSDLVSLRVKDVLEKDIVTIKEIKTGKTKTFQLNQSAKEAINEYLPSTSLSKEDFLFPSRKGGKLSRIAVWQMLEKVGVQGTHALRKTFGYHAFKQGVKLTLLQKTLNHSSPAITLRYIGITQDDINNVYLNLNL